MTAALDLLRTTLAAAEPPRSGNARAFRMFQAVRAELVKRKSVLIRHPRLTTLVKVQLALPKFIYGSIDEVGMLRLSTHVGIRNVLAYVTMDPQDTTDMGMFFQIRGRTGRYLDEVPVVTTSPRDFLGSIVDWMVMELLGPVRAKAAAEPQAEHGPINVRLFLDLLRRSQRKRAFKLHGATFHVFAGADTLFMEMETSKPTHLATSAAFKIQRDTVVLYRHGVYVPVEGIAHSLSGLLQMLAETLQRFQHWDGSPITVRSAAEPQPALGRMSIGLRGVGRKGRSQSVLKALQALGLDVSVNDISDRERWLNFDAPVKPELFRRILGTLVRLNPTAGPLEIYTGRGVYDVSKLPENARLIWNAFQSTTNERGGNTTAATEPAPRTGITGLFEKVMSLLQKSESGKLLRDYKTTKVQGMDVVVRASTDDDISVTIIDGGRDYHGYAKLSRKSTLTCVIMTMLSSNRYTTERIHEAKSAPDLLRQMLVWFVETHKKQMQRPARKA